MLNRTKESYLYTFYNKSKYSYGFYEVNDKIPWHYSWRSKSICIIFRSTAGWFCQSDTDLVFCSWVFDVRMTRCKKNWLRLAQKLFMINKQLHKEIRLKNLVIFNSANMDNVWASKEEKLVTRTAFFCKKFIRCLEFRFWPDPMQYRHMKDGNEK